MTFLNFFSLCQNPDSVGLSEIVLSSFPDSYNTNAVMKYMPIPVLTTTTTPPPPPRYLNKSSHESVFIIIFFAKILTLEFIGLHPYMC